jgi:hypothetical protein
MKKQAFQEDALLRATIREILYNEQPKIMNEGILSGIGSFLLGIINSVMALFGVEIKTNWSSGRRVCGRCWSRR